MNRNNMALCRAPRGLWVRRRARARTGPTAASSAQTCACWRRIRVCVEYNRLYYNVTVCHAPVLARLGVVVALRLSLIPYPLFAVII